MPLTEAQKRIYASAPIRSIVREGLVLQHPGFSRQFLLTNSPVAFFAQWEGRAQEFIPVPFTIIEPKRDDTAQQDLRLSIDNVNPIMMREIEGAASDFSEPVQCVYLVFADDDPRPQNDPPLVLFLSSLEVTPVVIVGTATRSDVVNAEFPRRYYRVNEFPGMAR